MPIDDDVKASVLILKANPVSNGSEIVAQVNAAGGAETAEDVVFYFAVQDGSGAITM